MKKLLFFLAVVLMSVTAVTVLSSCGDDEPDGNSIVGTWWSHDIFDGEYWSFTMHFNNDGTGYYYWIDEPDIGTFTYTERNNRIFFHDEYDSWICDYSIEGENLTLYGNPRGEEDNINVVHFTRQD